MATTPEGRAGQRRSYRDALEVLEARIALNDRRPPSERRDPAKIVISPSEPEAVLGLDKLRVFRPLYNAQLAYDLDSELVLGYGVFALPTDIGTLGPMLATVHALTGTRLSAMLAVYVVLDGFDFGAGLIESLIAFDRLRPTFGIGRASN